MQRIFFRSRVKQKLLFLVLTLFVLTLVASPAAYALYYSPSYYDKIAWTWEEVGPYTSTYNCLAYALGHTDRWIWPWGSSNPTDSEVDNYMAYLGYSNASWGTPYTPEIVSYGTSSEVVHFSKAFTVYSIAKWGSLELMKSYSWNPYNPQPDGYGFPVKLYF